jgi:hypothetical protein
MGFDLRICKMTTNGILFWISKMKLKVDSFTFNPTIHFANCWVIWFVVQVQDQMELCNKSTMFFYVFFVSIFLSFILLLIKTFPEFFKFFFTCFYLKYVFLVLIKF